MDIFYLDEQYGKVDGRKFTAINAAVINSSKINGFREKFYSGYSKLLKDGHRNALEGLIRPLPILQALLQNSHLEGFTSRIHAVRRVA